MNPGWKIRPVAEERDPNERAKGLLWMFQREPTGPPVREVAFDPSDAIYHLYRRTRNPFLERALAPTPRKLQRTPADLQRLFHFFERHERYGVQPGDARPPYERRGLQHPAPPRAQDAAYTDARRLPGNLQRLPWMVELFFDAVLGRLRSHPGRFKQVVEELMAEFQRDGIRIKLYAAYHTLQDWDDLMRTLEEIARYPAPETFDLFCSALFAYYDLAYPDEGR